MNPLDVADRVVSILQPYLHALADGQPAVDGGPAAGSVAQWLFDLLNQRLPYGQNGTAWTTFTQAPHEEAAINGLQAALREEFGADHGFADLIARQLPAGTPPPNVNSTSTITISGGQNSGINMATAPGAVAGDGNIVGSTVNTTAIRKLVQRRSAKISFVVLAVLLVAAIVLISTSSSSNNSNPQQPASSTPSAQNIGRATGLPTPSSAAPTSAAPTPTISAGSQIAQVAGVYGSWSDGKALTVLSGYNSSNGFSVSTYDVATGRQIGSFDAGIMNNEQYGGGCVDSIMLRSDGSSVVLLEYPKVTPAQGVVAGSTIEQLMAVGPATGHTFWTVPLPGYASDDNNNSGGPCVGVTNGHFSLTETSDDKFIVDTMWPDAPYVINIEDGSSFHEPNAIGAVGKWVGVEEGLSNVAGAAPAAVNLVDPSTQQVAGTITNEKIIRLLTEGGTNAAGGINEGAYSPNGTMLYTASYGAFSLPSGALSWQLPLDANGYLAAPWGTSVGVDPDTGASIAFGRSDDGTTGFSPTSGKVIWHQASTQYCGATNGHVYGIANEQLVVLDEATGTQLSYDPSVSECPSVLDGVIARNVPDSANPNSSTSQFTRG